MKAYVPCHFTTIDSVQCRVVDLRRFEQGSWVVSGMEEEGDVTLGDLLL